MRGFVIEYRESALGSPEVQIIELLDAGFGQHIAILIKKAIFRLS